MGRSRSPRGKAKANEWISRQIASLGRHPHKRPQGLHVDQNGNMLLEQLMATWGRSQGMKEPEVLGAVREHMFHEDGQLRFAIDADAQGRTKIRVLPKRDKGNRSGATPAWKGGHQRAAWGGRPTPEKPMMRGSVAKLAPKVAATPTPVLNTAKKLDMSLEELVNTENAVKTEDSWPAVTGQVPAYHSQNLPAYHQNLGQKAASTRRAVEQMGYTSGSSHVRLPGRGREKGKGARSRNGGGKGSWDGRPSYPRQEQRARSDSPRHRGHRDDVSRSPTPGDEDEMLAESTRKSLNVTADVGKRECPAPPPGIHWTKYADDGTVWFYYKGPLGEWWSTRDGDVQPYVEDEDE